MRIIITIIYTTVATLLFACEQQKPAEAIDPVAGLECFEAHRASLPPGTQYEGVDKRTGDKLTIRIMNGVDVVMLACTLNPDGSVQAASEP